jgi:hypothetical protein
MMKRTLLSLAAPLVLLTANLAAVSAQETQGTLHISGLVVGQQQLAVGCSSDPTALVFYSMRARLWCNATVNAVIVDNLVSGGGRRD